MFGIHFYMGYIRCDRLFAQNLFFYNIGGLNQSFAYFANNSNEIEEILVLMTGMN